MLAQVEGLRPHRYVAVVMATAFCPGEDAKPQQIERIARRCTTENLRKSARKDSCTVLTAPGQAQACTPNSGESSTPNNWESDSVEVTLEKEGGTR